MLISLTAKRVVMSILNEPASTTLPAADQRNIQHLKSFYSSCLDEQVLTRAGIDPVLEVIKDVLSTWRGQQGFGTQSSAMRVAPRKERLTGTLAYLHARGKLSSPLKCSRI